MEIRSVGVVGGGIMGQGIARAIAEVGLDVLLCEKDQKHSQASVAAIEGTLERDIARWGLTTGESDAIRKRITGTWKIWEISHCDLVIETITENFDMKEEVFARLEEVCPPEIIFVTNTSTLSITQLAACTKRPDRFVGMHFVTPVPRTKIVEVVRGLATSAETMQAIKEFAAVLKKTPIEVCDYPGYVTTRVMVPLINEAAYVVMEGVATAEDVDNAMKLGYNLECGPLALADRMGLDEVMSSMEHLVREIGDPKYRPCPLLRKLVRAGRLGVKTGEGFFKYNGLSLERR